MLQGGEVHRGLAFGQVVHEHVADRADRLQRKSRMDQRTRERLLVLPALAAWDRVRPPSGRIVVGPLGDVKVERAVRSMAAFGEDAPATMRVFGGRGRPTCEQLIDRYHIPRPRDGLPVTGFGDPGACRFPLRPGAPPPGYSQCGREGLSASWIQTKKSRASARVA